MVRLFWIAVFALFASAVSAEPFQATVTQDVAVRDGFLDTDPVATTLSAGTVVAVQSCALDQCLLEIPSMQFENAPWADGASFIIGAMPAVEYDKQRKRASSAIPRIDVWGDSLSTNTFGERLSTLLNREVEMFGVPGEDGSAIAKRMQDTPADPFALNILWDRHYTRQSVQSYLRDFAEMVSFAGANFIVISDIPAIGLPADAALTETINEALRGLYADKFLDVTAVLADASTRTDGLHLTPEGNNLVAQEIANFIRRNGL